jgi:hypothetical protein
MKNLIFGIALIMSVALIFTLLFTLVSKQFESETQDRIEYSIITSVSDLDAMEKLNMAGREGWEAVPCGVDRWLLKKRYKTDKAVSRY